MPNRCALNAAISFIALTLVTPCVLAAPPSAGNILQQTQSTPTMPSAPPALLSLPKPEQQAGQAAIKIAVQRIELEGNSLIGTATLMPLVATLQGHTVTLGDLRKAAAAVTRLYRRRGYALAYAYVPAQTIEHGVVRIAVMEPRYDSIAIEGHARFDTAAAKRTLNLNAGAPIEQGPLERGLLLLNQTPGIRVAGTLLPGARPGTSRLEATLSNTPLARVTTSVDNEGSKSTGRARYGLSLDLDNPWGHGSQLSLNRLSTEHGLLHATGMTLRSPNLYRGLRASLYGSHTTYHLGGSFANLHQTGRANQLGLGLSYPVVLEPGRLVDARVDVLGNRFSQESASVGLDDRSHVDLVRLTVNGALADAARGTTMGATTSGGISVSAGRLILDSANARTADASGPHAAGHFWVTQVQVQRSQPLAHEFHLQAMLGGQIASRNLDDSEKFYVGGYHGVMSYAEGEGGGDAGVLLSVELSHPIPLGMPGRLDGSLLGQYGDVWRNRSPWAGARATNRVHLGGAGVGLDYHWTTRLVAQLDYVRRLGSTPTGVGSDHQGEFWASLQLNF